jgi:hypothetical protein
LSTVKNGKAFEYACLQALNESLSPTQDVTVEMTPQFYTARECFITSTQKFQEKFVRAANAAARVIMQLEPQLEHPARNIPLFLSIQPDAQGQLGDVRDVLCIRNQNEWEIGLSCKHNHHAVKHSRLSATIDFGLRWFGVPCSKTYFDAVKPIFKELRMMREDSGTTAKWSEIKDKDSKYYVPVLRAFIDELQRIDKAAPSVIPERLIQYLIGKNDFYKVITNNAKKTTRVEAINISGSLNRPSDGKRSTVNVARLRLPKRFYNVDFMNDSKTTIEVVCDEGWSVSMRIHNASSRVEPSLKFDVNLISLPATIHAQVEPW